MTMAEFGCYRDFQFRVLMLQLDRATGRLSVDSAFRDSEVTQAGINFYRVHWPHGAAGSARPHGAIWR